MPLSFLILNLNDMKVFNRASLPREISYNGSMYKLDIESTNVIFNGGYLNKILPQSNKGDKVIVKVLDGRLKGKTDLHGKPYQPSQWIFSKQLSKN